MSEIGEAPYAWIVIERTPPARTMLRIARGAMTEDIELSEADLARLIAEAGSALHVRLLRTLRQKYQSEFITRRGAAKASRA